VKLQNFTEFAKFSEIFKIPLHL